MADYKDKIKELEEEISKTKYNKKTQHHIGLVKAKIAQLKEKEVKRSSGGKKGEGYSVRRAGDATVLLLGFPSAGKSTLLNALTNAQSDVAAYAFTTLTVIPGTLDYKHAKIQILDVPGIVRGASDGTGRGKEVLSVMRNADMAVILLDVNNPEHLPVILKEVYNTNIRLNQHKPDVRIKKTSKDGVRIGRTVRTVMTDQTIKGILGEFKMHNAEVLIREKVNEDQLIDIIEDNKIYMPAVTIVTKSDLVSQEKAREVAKKVKADLVISAEKNQGIDEVKDLIFDKLGFIRIFLKQPGQEADMEVPLIMYKNCNIQNVCEKLHKDFVSKFKFVRIWGPSARFDGQKLLSLKHVLKDKDVLEIHLI